MLSEEKRGQAWTEGNVLLQVINGHVLKVDLLGTVDVGSIGENADGHAGAGDMGQPELQIFCQDLRRNACSEDTHLTVPEKRLSRWGS